MRWVRANGRFGAWLALAALALQFAISFGHVHVDWFRQERTAALADASSRSSPPPHPTPQPGGDADAHCDICAVIHLAAKSFLPQPPRLPLPDVAYAIEHVTPLATVLVLSARSPFQSRAPPRG
jgi:hypothetical protein